MGRNKSPSWDGSKFHVFTNGWLERNDGSIDDYGRYQVQMNGKGSIVKMLQGV